MATSRSDDGPSHTNAASLHRRDVDASVPFVVYSIGTFNEDIAGFEIEYLNVRVSSFKHFPVAYDVPVAGRRAGIGIGDPIADHTYGLASLGLHRDTEKLLGNKGIGDAPGYDDHPIFAGILHLRQLDCGLSQEAPGLGRVQDHQD